MSGITPDNFKVGTYWVLESVSNSVFYIKVLRIYRWSSKGHPFNKVLCDIEVMYTVDFNQLLFVHEIMNQIDLSYDSFNCSSFTQVQFNYLRNFSSPRFL